LGIFDIDKRSKISYTQEELFENTKWPWRIVMQKKHVLYVDDDQDLLDLGKLLLEENDFMVDTVNSAREALKMIEKHEYEAIISDYQMPGMNGIEFFEAMLGRPPEKRIPFIFYTGMGKKEMFYEMRRLEPDAYVQKGGDVDIQFGELTQAVNKAVAQKKINQALQEAEQRLVILDVIASRDVKDIGMALSGYLELLKEDPSDASKHLAGIENAMHALTEYLNDMATYQSVKKNDCGWQHLSMTIGRQAKSYPGLNFINDVGELKIFTANLLLEKAFHVLFENTKKHGEKATTVTVSYEEREDNFIVVYKDNGVGIAPESKEDIFRHNYGDSEGLGLFLLRELFDAVQMSIVEDGEYGRGARFKILIPKEKCLLR
jgi:CheY-like chemotaxis protein